MFFLYMHKCVRLCVSVYVVCVWWQMCVCVCWLEEGHSFVCVCWGNGVKACIHEYGREVCVGGEQCVQACLLSVYKLYGRDVCV